MAIDFAQGTFAGDSTTGRSISCGFPPKVVNIKGDQATVSSVSLIYILGLNACKYIAGTLANSYSGIESLSTDGFKVGYYSGDSYQTNKTGDTYYWEAWGNAGVVPFSYTGDANATQSITGIGFQPTMVWIAGTTGSAPNTAMILWWCQSTMGANLCSSWNNLNQATNSITSLDADGFTIGANTGVHSNGATYYGVAFDTATNFAVGNYTGDGADDTNYPASAMSFDPEFVACRRTNTTDTLKYRNLSLVGDLSFMVGSGAAVSNQIQSLTPASGQFQVGTGLNAATRPYHFFSFDGAVAPAVAHRRRYGQVI